MADLEVASKESLDRYATSGRSWLAADGDMAVGFILVDVVDGRAHIEEVSVLPDWQRQGIGRALLGRVRDWARQEGLAGLSLTTFSEVPWNRPYYEGLGFSVLPESALGPGLRAVRDANPPAVSTRQPACVCTGTSGTSDIGEARRLDGLWYLEAGYVGNIAGCLRTIIGVLWPKHNGAASCSNECS
ncbi:MAG TPA: GNAT family N-acetyltransferase [Actinomycetota bacterium]|nr:GNAT family N-acetyltransferase [Actinomycetota bacterium]